jgi:hypothetical protein
MRSIFSHIRFRKIKSLRYARRSGLGSMSACNSHLTLKVKQSHIRLKFKFFKCELLLASAVIQTPLLGCDLTPADVYSVHSAQHLFHMPTLHEPHQPELPYHARLQHAIALYDHSDFCARRRLLALAYCRPFSR